MKLDGIWSGKSGLTGVPSPIFRTYRRAGSRRSVPTARCGQTTLHFNSATAEGGASNRRRSPSNSAAANPADNWPTGREPPKSSPTTPARTAAPTSVPLPGSVGELARSRSVVGARPSPQWRSKPTAARSSCPSAPATSGRNRAPPHPDLIEPNLSVAHRFVARPARAVRPARCDL